MESDPVKAEKLSVFVFDEPDKYIKIARERLAASATAEKVSDSRYSRKTGKRRSAFRWLQRQWTVESEFVQLSTTGDRILSRDQHDVIFSFLPARFQTGNSILAFATHEHGTSIGTFLHKLEAFHATLIVIKTTNREIFGAFCSGQWSDRNNKNLDLNFFGLGETFLFTFEPDSRVYPWVGWTTMDKPNLPISKSLFLAANSNTIVIGGGGDSGIRFQSDLSRGYTGSSMTFDNKPLCPSRDFIVSRMEVYGLTT